MSAITTHVLDLSLGKPGAGIPVRLEYRSQSGGWQTIGDGVTDRDGRINDLVSAGRNLEPGHYRLGFETGPYFLLRDVECFFPQVTISFVVKDSVQPYHVPLLLSPFGYSTYRGS